jgi:SOS-response transcriptional repressor LexA
VELPRAALTPVERKLWHFLLDHLAEHTYQPSVREIARQLRIPSTRTVTDLLRALENKHYVRRAPGRSRGVILEGFSGAIGTQPVPIVHFSADGHSTVERHLTLDRAFLPTDEAYFVQATGEDAPAHAVREGDLLLVHPDARIPEDAPVVARVGRSILVRTQQHRGAAVVLKAPSADARDLVLGADDGFRVLGPLAAVLRRTMPHPDETADDESAEREREG